MAGENRRTMLGDYFTLQRGTTYKSRLLGQPGPVLLGLATIQRNGGFRTDSLQTYGGDSPDKLLVHPGDLYLSLKDVTQSADLLGAVARLPRDHPPGRLTQDTVKLQPKDDRVPLNYLHWLLRTPQYRSYCRSHATGTTNLGLARDDFLAFHAPEPTPTQDRIVQTLDALEDKIELNRRMNETLEAMARALFKSWFVDFDPVRAKAEGRDPGLPQPLAALFPDSFEDSEMGEIPRGWEVKSLDEIARFLNGLALQKFPPTNGRSLPVIKIAQLRAGSTQVADQASADLAPDYFVADGDILFSWSGSLECVLWAGGRGALNQHLFKVTSTDFPRWLCYLGIHVHIDDFRHIAAGKATTMGHIQRHHLSDAKVAVPASPLLDAIDARMSPIIEGLWKRAVESRSLATLRDALLPKLISGELRVKEAERCVVGVSASTNGAQA
jgi:type I restriction enzyme, S subunit